MQQMQELGVLPAYQILYRCIDALFGREGRGIGLLPPFCMSYNWVYEHARTH